MHNDRRHLLKALAALAAAPALAGADEAAAMQFPRDFGAHPGTRLEWWYLTGLLAEAARPELPRYGYQLTFFRLLGPARADHPSRFAARQLLLGHAALSDLAAGRLRHEQRLARAGFGLAEAAEEDCDVHIEDWRLRRSGTVEQTGYEASFKAADFALDLRLQRSQPLLLQGRGGISRKGPAPDQFSHYYSQVQLQTAATLELDGRRLALQGRSWLDHEWSDSLLGKQQTADRAAGWDWLGINLADGGALTLFRLRRADGSLLWAGGSWCERGGRTQDLAPDQLRMRPLRHWRSPASGADYPVEWELQALQTPLGLLRLRALIDAQEIDARRSSGMRYWEGASELLGADGVRLGLGYLELTGYAGRLTF
ncbi:MAG: carotenoid 1,2-hydratase [Burkholderiaceae bacterium]